MVPAQAAVWEPSLADIFFLNLQECNRSVEDGGTRSSSSTGSSCTRRPVILPRLKFPRSHPLPPRATRQGPLPMFQGQENKALLSHPPAGGHCQSSSSAQSSTSTSSPEM
ncbi:hypothetical protein BaRGS_00004512 [Batillaria attramentaria]|uniref:Uncharacterized protein n=1 Tax=Batillaria attramentaria TaxID=370345 RepID=A0ABD0LYL7_9CAEN